MSKKHTIKPLAIAISAVFAATIAGTSTASADTTPFSMTSLTSGYQVAHLGEGSCGGDKGDKDKEGSCGGDKGDKGEGHCGGDKGEHEGSSGGEKGEEGSCGDDKGDDKGEEGKCGEGKCGGTV